MTKITKIILATINLPKGTHLNGCDSYQNVQVKALPLSAKFSSEEKEKTNTEYILQQICTYFLTL